MKHLVNPAMRAILRSPLHRLAGSHIALIDVTGRRSGRTYSIPVRYRRDGDLLVIDVGRPARKQWWRNVRERPAVRLLVQGQWLRGYAEVRGDQQSGLAVSIALTPDTSSESSNA